jgi:hypothetical protein
MKRISAAMRTAICLLSIAVLSTVAYLTLTVRPANACMLYQCIYENHCYEQGDCVNQGPHGTPYFCVCDGAGQCRWQKGCIMSGAADSR